MLDILRKNRLESLYSRKIKKLREKRGFTQKQLSQLCGISESAMRSYELGDRKPKREILKHIAKALKVRPEYLTAPEILSKMEFYYAILDSDENMGYIITELNGRPAIIGSCSTAGYRFSQFLRDWNEMKQKLDAKEITQEEYEDWKETYDPGTWVGTPDGKSPWTGK